MRHILNAYGQNGISPVGENSLKNLSALSGNLLLAQSREVILASVLAKKEDKERELADEKLNKQTLKDLIDYDQEKYKIESKHRKN